jgi:hypothetical protein
LKQCIALNNSLIIYILFFRYKNHAELQFKKWVLKWGGVLYTSQSFSQKILKQYIKYKDKSIDILILIIMFSKKMCLDDTVADIWGIA